MSLRSIVALAILALQLAACTADHRNNKTTIDDMEHRHTEDMQRMGGGGSGGGSM
jgi:hypothetical protein